MKTKLFLLLAMFSLAFQGATAAETTTNRPIRMIIIGDSTVCHYPAKSPRRGWGMYIQNYFDSNELQVSNLALSGRTKPLLHTKESTTN